MNKEIIKKSEEYIEENNINTNTYKVSKAFIDGAKWYRDNVVNENYLLSDVMASVSDELLLKAGKYEDEANADIETEGVQHNLNIGRYDGLMQAVQEINKHLT